MTYEPSMFLIFISYHEESVIATKKKPNAFYETSLRRWRLFRSPHSLPYRQLLLQIKHGRFNLPVCTHTRCNVRDLINSQSRLKTLTLTLGLTWTLWRTLFFFEFNMTNQCCLFSLGFSNIYVQQNILFHLIRSLNFKLRTWDFNLFIGKGFFIEFFLVLAVPRRAWSETSCLWRDDSCFE